MNEQWLMVRRQLRANRISGSVLTVLMVLFTVVQIQGYKSAFPNPHTREQLLATFTDNGALRFFYGYPFNIGNATGWVAWRSMSTVAIVIAFWAAFVTIGALRGEEEAGRAELVLGQPQSRQRWVIASIAAVTIETAAIGAVSVSAMALVGIPQHLMSFSDCLDLGLQMVLPAILFAGVGALFSQVFGTRRAASIAVGVVLAGAMIIRAPADVGSGITWIRWLSPLGWFEELRPPASPSVGALIAIASGFIFMVLAALRLVRDRDLGEGLLPNTDSRHARLWLLGREWQAALREELPLLAMWMAGGVAYGGLMGGLIKTALDAVAKDNTVTQVTGGTPSVNLFVAASLSVVQLLSSLLVVALMVSARGEESSGRLEVVVAEPLSRIRWLTGRALLASLAALILTLLSTTALWIGAGITGEGFPLGSSLGAALNIIPIIVISAGCATAVLGTAPRAVAGMYAVVGAAFVWDALSALLKTPSWLANLSPFHALAQIPVQQFQVTPVIVLLVLGLGLAVAGIAQFASRDLIPG